MRLRVFRAWRFADRFIFESCCCCCCCRQLLLKILWQGKLNKRVLEERTMRLAREICLFNNKNYAVDCAINFRNVHRTLYFINLAAVLSALACQLCDIMCSIRKMASSSAYEWIIDLIKVTVTFTPRSHGHSIIFACYLHARIAYVTRVDVVRNLVPSVILQSGTQRLMKNSSVSFLSIHITNNKIISKKITSPHTFQKRNARIF